MIKAFILVAVTLAVVHCYYPGALRRSSLRELTQDEYGELRTGPEEMFDYRFNDQLERRDDHGCKYAGYPCAGENYSYGCKDYTRDRGYVSTLNLFFFSG